MVPPGYILGQVAPRVEEPEEPLYVNAKQVSPLVFLFSFMQILQRQKAKSMHYLQRDSLDGDGVSLKRTGSQSNC